MARTAPVPNIPAPPGMNPGAFVAGGGGDGGGKGGKGGKNGNGEEGAGTGDGDEDANGDGNNGGACGEGGPGGCTNCEAGMSAGDPVNVVTGDVFTVPEVDLRSPGPIALVLKRHYSTHLGNVDIGLGFGWRHSLAWSLHEGRRSIEVTSPLGKVIEFSRDEAELGAFGDGGFVLRRLGESGYALDSGDGFVHRFEATGVADEFRLFEVVHRNGNGFNLVYDTNGDLKGIVDSAGRVIRVSTHRGRIISLSTKDPTGSLITHASYKYDDRGCLIEHTDGDGVTTRYEYDEAHRLTSYRKPSGLRFHFIYDRSGRCIETWGDYGDEPIPGLDPDAPSELTDGTPARGIYHTKLDFGDGYSEVVDSMRLLRTESDPTTGQITLGVGADGGVTTRVLDAAGNTIEHTDAEGAVTTYEYDARGRLLKETNALGHSFEIVRDSYGQVVKNVDLNGAVVTCERDAVGNVTAVTDQRNARTAYEFDQRSLLTKKIDPGGGVTHYESDAHGNLTRATFPNGAQWLWEWDYFGRNVARVDPLGRREEYRYSPAGRILERRRGQQVTHYTYDQSGQLSQVAGAHGTKRFHWGGQRWSLGATFSDGSSVRLLYNREGWRTKTLNENGETLSWDHTPSGYVGREVSFDGSELRVTYDLLGRYTSWHDPARERIEFERDAIGRLIGFEWGDGSKHSFELDALGDDIRATKSDSSVCFDRDPTGRVLREEQAFADTQYTVNYEYDLMGRVVGRESSLGHRQRLRRDASGRVIESELDGWHRVLVKRDALGAARVWNFGEFTVEQTYDERNRLISRKVVQPGQLASSREPEWVGDSPETGLYKWFEYDARDDLRSRWDSSRGKLEYKYDLRGRLLEVSSEEAGTGEAFRSDRAANVIEVLDGVAQHIYERGNRLVRFRGDVRERNAAGYLVRRVTQEGEWLYEWSPEGWLAAVDRPDGGRVEFAYDCYGRRIQKRVLAANPTGGHYIEREFHYVWAKERLLHELELAEGAVRKLRTFVYVEGTSTPLMQGDATPGNKTEWSVFVCDPIGTPEQLLDLEGNVLHQIERSAYGDAGSGVTATPLRFPGQFHDPETGLHYNRFRYYDPRAGRYISPDPIGIDASLNTFGYTVNPIGWTDPTGLARHQATCSLTTGGDDSDTYVPTSEYSRGPGFRSTAVHDVPGARSTTSGELHEPHTDRVGQPTGNTAVHEAHTEQNAIEWAEANFSPEELEGSTMRLGGDYPPCPRCHEAMQRFARQHNSRVEYNWPVNNRMMYDGSYGGGSADRAAFRCRGTDARDLGREYRRHERAGSSFSDTRASYDAIYERQRDAGTLGGRQIDGHPQTGRSQHTLPF